MEQIQGLGQKTNVIDTSYKVGFLIFSLLFLVFPYWNGLFFHLSFSYSAIYLFLSLLILGLLWKNKGTRVDGWSTVDLFAVGYVVSYVIAAISPANYEQAIIGIIRHISYLGVYAFVRILLGAGIARVMFLRVLSVSGFLIALYGLAAGFGTIVRAGAIWGDRLSSVFEYPNTAASYIVITFVVTSAIIVITQSRIERTLYGIALYLMLVFTVYASSRGAWLIMGALLVSMVLFAPKGVKAAFLTYLVSPVVAFIVTSSWLGQAITNKQQLKGWLVLLLGMLLASALVYLSGTFQGKIRIKMNGKLKIALISVIGLILITIVVFADKILPQSILTRIALINLGEFSAVQRFVLYKDALNAFTNNPIFGNGYGTWVSSYQSFQYYPYNAKQSHGILFDVLLDVGTLGLLLFIGLLAAVGKKWWNGYKEALNTTDKLLMQAVLFATIALFGHALMDFDLSYALMNYLLWTLMAISIGPLIVSTPNQVIATLSRDNQKGNNIFWLTLALTSLVGGIVITGYAASERIVQSMQQSAVDPVVALKQIDTGTLIAPYRADMWSQKAKALDFLYEKNSNDKAKTAEIKDSAQKAVNLAPFDVKNAVQAANLYAKYGEGIKALSLYKAASQNGKFNMQALEIYLKNSDLAGAQFYATNKVEAKHQFDNGWKAFVDAEQKIQGFSGLPKTLRLEFPFELSPVMRMNAAETAYYLGKYEEVSRVLAPILNGTQKVTEDITNKANLLEYAAKNKRGTGNNLNEQEISIIKAKKQEYAQFLEYILKIEPLT